MTLAATLPPTASSGPDLSAYAGLLDSLRVPRPVDPDVSALVDAAVEVWSRPGFDTLLSLPR